MLISRRGILGGLASMIAAPAIVHAGNLMPVKVMDDPSEIFVDRFGGRWWSESGCWMSINVANKPHIFDGGGPCWTYVPAS